MVPFKPGQSGNPKGRPKGSRHKLGEDFIATLQADFAVHGAAVITKVRTEYPHHYLKVLASLLPKELNIRTAAVKELTDDELEGALAVFKAMMPDGQSEPTGATH